MVIKTDPGEGSTMSMLLFNIERKRFNVIAISVSNT